MKKARTKPFCLFTVFCSALLDSMIVAFHFSIRISIMTAKGSLNQSRCHGGPLVGSSKLKYETLQISGGFIKFSECQVPCANAKPLCEDFLATVLV